MNYNTILATLYNDDAYGEGEYNDETTTTTTQTPTVISNIEAKIANTDYSTILFVAFGTAILIAAIILIVSRLRRKRKPDITNYG